MSDRRIQVKFYLDESTVDAVDALAEANGESRSALLRKLVCAGLGSEVGTRMFGDVNLLRTELAATG